MKPEGLKIWSEIAGIWIAILSVIAGGLYTLKEYKIGVENKMVRESLAYVDKYNSGPIFKSRYEIEKLWVGRDKELVDHYRANGEKKLSKYILSILRKSETQVDLEIIISFYENIKICMCAKICDSNTIRKYFSRSAYVFWGTSYPYISLKRGIYTDKKGDRISRFATAIELIGKKKGSGDLFFKTVCSGGGQG